MRLGRALVLGLSLVAPTAARADVTKGQCVDANGRAQDLRRDGKLGEARAALLLCASAQCPALVRADCTTRLDELDRAQPTVLFDVRGPDGGDVFDVRVSVDGKRLADRLEGSALKVDPGAHVFTFEAPGRQAATVKLLVREGEKARRERVAIGAQGSALAPAPAVVTAAPASQAAPVEADTAQPAASSGGLGARRTIALALGAAGVAGLAVGGIFGALTLSAWSNAKNACGGRTSACVNASTADSDRSTAESDATVSDVGFIAGGVLLAAGAAIFFTGGKRADAEATTGLVIVPAMGAGEAGLVVRGGF